MALSNFKGLLQSCKSPIKTGVRLVSGNRINVGKPGPVHYDRARIEFITRPKFFEKGERDAWFIPSAAECLKEQETALKGAHKSEINPYEQLLAKDLRNLFEKSKLIAFFHSNPIRFDDRFEAEVRLYKEGMVLKKHGKHTVQIALEGTPYISVMPLFVSHTEIVFCEEPKVDRLLKVASKLHYHVLLAAIVEGRLLSVSQLKALGQVKDITTARSQLVAVLNAHQTQLVSSLTYHQSSIVSGLQQLADKPPAESEKQPAAEPQSENPPVAESKIEKPAESTDS